MARVHLFFSRDCKRHGDAERVVAAVAHDWDVQGENQGLSQTWTVWVMLNQKLGTCMNLYSLYYVCITDCQLLLILYWCIADMYWLTYIAGYQLLTDVVVSKITANRSREKERLPEFPHLMVASPGRITLSVSSQHCIQTCSLQLQLVHGDMTSYWLWGRIQLNDRNGYNKHREIQQDEVLPCSCPAILNNWLWPPIALAHWRKDTGRWFGQTELIGLMPFQDSKDSQVCFSTIFTR